MKPPVEPDKLLPSAVYKRRQEEYKKGLQSAWDMNNRISNVESNNYQQSIASSKDKYMIDAYAKVQQNKHISFEQTLIDFNGTSLWHGDKKPS